MGWNRMLGAATDGSRGTRRGFVAALAMLAVCGSGRFARAERSVAEEKQAAANLIPYDKLTPQASQKILAVMERHSLFRRVPAAVIDCDQDMFRNCLRSPEVVVNIWQLMGITSCEAKRTGAYTWTGTDGQGTTGDVELIYGSDKLHIYYCDGWYEGALFRKKLTGRAVMIVQSTPTVGQDRKPMMTSQLDFFMQLDNAGADLIAKTLSPIISSTADANYSETASFIGKISQAAERNGPGIQNLANKLQNVKPEVRQEFAQTAAAVNERAAARATAGGTSVASDGLTEFKLKPAVAERK